MKTNTKQITDTELTLGFCPRSLLVFTQFALLIKRNEENQKKIKSKKGVKTLGTIMATALILFWGINTNAQQDSIKTMPFQMTFVTTLGTNGLNAWNITNKFSVNLYAGYNGGLDGVELSSFAGVLKNNMVGTQIAGFGNGVLGTGNGVQLAGFANFVNKDYKGVQAAGFANVICGKSSAIQLSGFSNVALDSFDGIQITGFANASVKEITKIQLSGFANYSKGNGAGQITGFSNVNTGSLKGIQLAGFSNVNTETVQGVQIAGFSNYTKKLKGVQIAPFNYVDSLESGIPIGIFSIVRNGYRAFEISVNETLYGVASFKTGVKSFYNIISVGASYREGKYLWGWGYGIGTLIQLKEDWNLGIELLSYHINENEWFTDEMIIHNKLQITASKKVSNNMEVFGGASWNVNVSETIDKNGNAFESSATPYDVFDKTYGNDNNVKMYPGFTAGIRF
ncbi:MAG: hypothetical protein C0597_07680 [Marinilabiliales bacterium]|nr:MAG: hypothetical protein C0597_07680 [Marinilabiliales bacterium]